MRRWEKKKKKVALCSPGSGCQGLSLGEERENRHHWEISAPSINHKAGDNEYQDPERGRAPSERPGERRRARSCLPVVRGAAGTFLRAPNAAAFPRRLFCACASVVFIDLLLEPPFLAWPAHRGPWAELRWSQMWASAFPALRTSGGGGPSPQGLRLER